MCPLLQDGQHQRAPLFRPSRDIDVIAIAWVEQPDEPELLVQRLCGALAAKVGSDCTIFCAEFRRLDAKAAAPAGYDTDYAGVMP